MDSTRTMISFAGATGRRFNCRVAAIIINQNRVLLNRAQTDSFWILPGGRAELGESSEQTLLREMQEELGVIVKIDRLLWLVEGFFSCENVPCHEIAFYYLVSLPNGHDKLSLNQFEIEDGGEEILFKWFPLEEIPDMEIFPSFLLTGLQSLPDCVQHIVHEDTRSDLSSKATRLGNVSQYQNAY